MRDGKRGGVWRADAGGESSCSQPLQCWRAAYRAPRRTWTIVPASPAMPLRNVGHGQDRAAALRAEVSGRNCRGLPCRPEWAFFITERAPKPFEKRGGGTGHQPMRLEGNGSGRTEAMRKADSGFSSGPVIGHWAMVSYRSCCRAFSILREGTGVSAARLSASGLRSVAEHIAGKIKTREKQTSPLSDKAHVMFALMLPGRSGTRRKIKRK